MPHGSSGAAAGLRVCVCVHSGSELIIVVIFYLVIIILITLFKFIHRIGLQGHPS